MTKLASAAQPQQDAGKIGESPQLMFGRGARGE